MSPLRPGFRTYPEHKTEPLTDEEIAKLYEAADALDRGTVWFKNGVRLRKAVSRLEEAETELSSLREREALLISVRNAYATGNDKANRALSELCRRLANVPIDPRNPDPGNLLDPSPADPKGPTETKGEG